MTSRSYRAGRISWLLLAINISSLTGLQNRQDAKSAKKQETYNDAKSSLIHSSVVLTWSEFGTPSPFETNFASADGADVVWFSPGFGVWRRGNCSAGASVVGFRRRALLRRSLPAEGWPVRTVRSLIGRLALSQWNRSEEARRDSKQRHHEK